MSKRKWDYVVYLEHLNKFRHEGIGTSAELIARFAKVSKLHSIQKPRLGRSTLLALKNRGEMSDAEMESFLNNFSLSDTDYHFIRFAASNDQLRHVSSLRDNLTLRTRRMLKHGRDSCPEWILQDKKNGYLFADALGMPRPNNSLKPLHLKDLVFEEKMALKPPNASGSSGVYLIYSAEHIVDVRTGKVITGLENLRAQMEEDIATRRIPSPYWNTEELMIDSANEMGSSHDWKFYSFYGETCLIGTMQRYPHPAEVWMEEDGRKADLWARPRESETEWDAREIPEALMEKAREISLAVPIPFLRIDFLSSDRGFVLGEFTARPGVLHLLSRKQDRRLGEAFISAEHRLYEDLRRGKKFTAFDNFLSDLNSENHTTRQDIEETQSVSP
jgi:hypothetical protein